MSTVYSKPNSYTHLATNTETAVKTGSGVLHSVTVNTKGTVASTLSIYDGSVASGTLIAVIDSLNIAGHFVYDVGFTTSLTIKTTGTVAPDITVVYK